MESSFRATVLLVAGGLGARSLNGLPRETLSAMDTSGRKIRCTIISEWLIYYPELSTTNQERESEFCGRTGQDSSVTECCTAATNLVGFTAYPGGLLTFLRSPDIN